MKTRVVHLNTVATGGAIPNLVRILHQQARGSEFFCELIFGRGAWPDGIPARRVGHVLSQAWDLLQSRLFDSAGQQSGAAASRVLRMFGDDRPDIVHLHNLHGYWMKEEEL